jgi:hypothetical protein
MQTDNFFINFQTSTPHSVAQIIVSMGFCYHYVKKILLYVSFVALCSQKSSGIIIQTMRHSYKWVLGITSIALVGAVMIYFARKDQTIKKRAQEVADEGYETAYDILYPLDRRRLRFF